MCLSFPVDEKNDGKLNEKERLERLTEKLRRHPHLMERFEAIMELTQSESGPIRKADEVEELLVQEMRKLGNRAMQEWAAGAEAARQSGLRQEVAGTRIYKKSPELVVCFWIGERPGAPLASSRARAHARVRRGGGPPCAGQIAAAPAGGVRLWG